MQIRLNKKTKEGEMVFSWRELWILLKKRKLTLNVKVLDNLTVALISIRHEIHQEEKNNTK